MLKWGYISILIKPNHSKCSTINKDEYIPGKPVRTQELNKLGKQKMVKERT